MTKLVYKVDLDAIVVGERRRDVDDDKVSRLAESIKAIGLQQPISVWEEPDPDVPPGTGITRTHLVAGLHRLRAAQLLGWDEIDAIEVELDDIDRKRWEIAENLHRSELTALERDQHIAEWIRLTEAAEKLRQSDAVSKPNGGRGKTGGTRKAAREIGISEPDARRAVKVDGLTPEAKEAAREAGLDDNRSALLRAAAKPAEEQANAIREIAAAKAAPEPDEEDDPEWTEEDEQTLEALQVAWDNATEKAREAFRGYPAGRYGFR